MAFTGSSREVPDHPGKSPDHPGKSPDHPGKSPDHPGNPTDGPGKSPDHPGKPTDHPGKPTECSGRPADDPFRGPLAWLKPLAFVAEVARLQALKSGDFSYKSPPPGRSTGSVRCAADSPRFRGEVNDGGGRFAGWRASREARIRPDSEPRGYLVFISGARSGRSTGTANNKFGWTKEIQFMRPRSDCHSSFQ